jgi:hypothetical protein
MACIGPVFPRDHPWVERTDSNLYASYQNILAGMELENPRMWVFYYLICFVALLWVGFLAVQGVMIYVSLVITMTVFGFSVLLCVMLVMDLREKEKQEVT